MQGQRLRSRWGLLGQSQLTVVIGPYVNGVLDVGDPTRLGSTRPEALFSPAPAFPLCWGLGFLLAGPLSTAVRWKRDSF